jgi:hypothetical protein
MSGNQTREDGHMRASIILTAILLSCGFGPGADAQQADMTSSLQASGPARAPISAGSPAQMPPNCRHQK